MTELPRYAVWFVCAALVVAAVIDGKKLKVPNWLTLPLVASGLVFHAWAGGFDGLGWSLMGGGVGLVTLGIVYAIGGMGAGDVKLFAGVGAWVGPVATWGAFVWLAPIGAAMAIAMVLWSGEVRKHWEMFKTIAREILVIRDPVALSEIAAARKPSMLLLPYGIPIAVGSILYFARMGMLS